MNLLIVDDQKIITDSLKEGIEWGEIGVSHVYTAYSAKEAKLILLNLNIDIMLTDIEMPEEDGLSLVEWTRSRYPDLVCIFLTSHAEFSYARKAINLQSFDYILQPARFEEVEKVIGRACEKINDNKKIRQLWENEALVLRQRNVLMDSMMTKLLQDNDKDVESIFQCFPEMFHMERENCEIYPLMVCITRWKKEKFSWNHNLICMVLQNILEELLESAGGKTCISYQQDYGYSILVIVDREQLPEGFWGKTLEDFYHFIHRNMDFRVAVYPGEQVREEITPIFRKLIAVSKKQADHPREGLFWDYDGDEKKEKNKDIDAVKTAVAFIKENLDRNVSRSEVAKRVFLNEEYFSRLFRQQTGYTFKNFVLMEKMNAARNMLEQTGLSVSIIASKVGFDNFSHFSKTFKRFSGMTPQEFRKETQKKMY